MVPSKASLLFGLVGQFISFPGEKRRRVHRHSSTWPLASHSKSVLTPAGANIILVILRPLRFTPSHHFQKQAGVWFLEVFDS